MELSRARTASERELGKETLLPRNTFLGWYWLERLSLDAVLVVLMWGLSLGMLAGRPMDGIELSILGLSTWLAYVGDRLLDLRAGRKDTDRHRFHRQHARCFACAWVIVCFLTLFLSWNYLERWKFEWACAIAGAVFIYGFLLQWVRQRGPRFLLKRSVVPLLFAAGTGLIAEAWRSREALWAVAILWIAAMINLTLISFEENRFEAIELRSLMERISLGLICLSGILAMALAFTSLPLGLASAYGAACFAFIWRKVKGDGLPGIRMWTDAALADMAIILILLELF